MHCKMILFRRQLFSLLCANAFIAGMTSEILGKELREIVNDYRVASRKFFEENPSAEDRIDFYNKWLQTILDECNATTSPESRCLGLEVAESIANSAGNHREFINIVKEILKSCTNENDNNFSKINWLVELGDASRAEWRKSGDPEYFNEATEALDAVMNTESMELKSVELKILAAGWYGELLESGPTTTKNINKGVNHLRYAIGQFENGFKPKGRLVGTGFDAEAFLQQLLRLDILAKNYAEAISVGSQYNKTVLSKKIDASGVLVFSDQSPKFHIDNRADLDEYVRFIDNWNNAFPGDRDFVKVLLISARRLFAADRLEESRDRYEYILANYSKEIDSSKHRDYYLSEIWGNLVSIYARLGDAKKLKEAAEKAIASKQLLGQGVKPERSHIESQNRKEAHFRDLRVRPNNHGNRSYVFWVILVNSLLVAFCVVVFLLRHRFK